MNTFFSKNIRDKLGPLIEDAIDEVCPLDNVRWDLTYMQLPPVGQVSAVLILTKPSPLLGAGLVGAAPLDETALAGTPNAVEIKNAVRDIIEGLRQQETAITQASKPPLNGQH